MGRVVGLVLAAGRGRRMGAMKQLLPLGEGAMIDVVMGNVRGAGLEGVAVVNGEVRAYLKGRVPNWWQLAVNDEAGSEMLRSVQVGVEAVGREFGLSERDGVMVVLGDQPGVGVEAIRKCREAFLAREAGVGILIATYGGRRGHPAVFEIGLLERVKSWGKERKLSELAREEAGRVEELEMGGELPEDVNTPEEYRRARDGIEA